jgi:hypothetical protein
MQDLKGTVLNNMSVQLDVYMSFPADADTEQALNKLHKYFGSVEAVERAFEIEFSCGDGKFLSDDSDFVDEEELGKYDGEVCLQSLPQSFILGNLLQANKKYRFTVRYYEQTEELAYLFNGKEVRREWAGG